MNGPALFNAMARIARHHVQTQSIAEIAEVTALHSAEPGTIPPDHAVTVTLRGSGLSLPKVPIAVQTLGSAAMPNVGDLVVVLFMGGDVHEAVVIGQLYHADLSPPEHAPGQQILALPAGSNSPNLLREISGDPATYRLTLPGDVMLEMVENTTTLKAGEVAAVINGAGGGRIELQAGGTKITLKKDGELKIESAGDLTLTANNIDIKGSGKVAISGATVEVN